VPSGRLFDGRHRLPRGLEISNLRIFTFGGVMRLRGKHVIALKTLRDLNQQRFRFAIWHRPFQLLAGGPVVLDEVDVEAQFATPFWY
jgi:hypothetical protein